jgi:hypothetical protein
MLSFIIKKIPLRWFFWGITSKREDLDRLKNTIKNSLEQIIFYDFQHTFELAEKEDSMLSNNWS